MYIQKLTSLNSVICKTFTFTWTIQMRKEQVSKLKWGFNLLCVGFIDYTKALTYQI